MEEQKLEQGCSQGRERRQERTDAQRALILGGSPSGGYDSQNQLQRAPLYCVRSREILSGRGGISSENCASESNHARISAGVRSRSLLAVCVPSCCSENFLEILLDPQSSRFRAN